MVIYCIRFYSQSSRLVLPLVPYRRGRESEADDIAQLSLTKIQFSSRKSWLYTSEELLSFLSADGLNSSATCGLTVFLNGCLAMLIFGIRWRNIQMWAQITLCFISQRDYFKGSGDCRSTYREMNPWLLKTRQPTDITTSL